jgi:hypothetical protein
VSDHPIGFHWKALDLATFDGRDLPAPTSKAEQEARSSILTEAYLIHRLDPDGWVSYSRNKTWYSAAPRYRGSAYTYTTVTRSIDMLAAVGLLNHNKAPPGTYRQIQSTFKASPSLIAALGSAPLPVLYDPAETLLLRDRDKNLIQYRDTEETRSIRKNLAIINEALEAAAVAHPDLGEVLDGTPVRLGKVVPGPAKRTLHRVFTESWNHHGRFYGPWWQKHPEGRAGAPDPEWRADFEADYRGCISRWPMPPQAWRLRAILTKSERGRRRWSSLASTSSSTRGTARRRSGLLPKKSEDGALSKPPG